MGITRREMYSRLQMDIVRLMEPLTENALLDYEKARWRGDYGDDDPHGRPWHTSFHASSFPGDNEFACPRQALYTMMNIPSKEAFSPKSRLMMDLGSQVEHSIVMAYHHYGILLSPPPTEPVQLGFVDPESWLTGNCDAVIKHPRLKRPHVFECKMKYEQDLKEMRVGLKGPDPRHVFQVKVYIAFLNLLSKQLWPDLPVLRDGTIYYVSRDNPRLTAEFHIDLDEKFREHGRAQLKRWKEWFEEDILPSQLAGVIDLDTNSKGKEVASGRHPLGKKWKWTQLPCKWCDYGKVCREDFKGDVTALSDSHAIGHARDIRGDYDYEKTREAVFAAWEDAGDEVVVSDPELLPA